MCSSAQTQRCEEVVCLLSFCCCSGRRGCPRASVVRAAHVVNVVAVPELHSVFLSIQKHYLFVASAPTGESPPQAVAVTHRKKKCWAPHQLSCDIVVVRPEERGRCVPASVALPAGPLRPATDMPTDVDARTLQIFHKCEIRDLFGSAMSTSTYRSASAVLKPASPTTMYSGTPPGDSDASPKPTAAAAAAAALPHERLCRGSDKSDARRRPLSSSDVGPGALCRTTILAAASPRKIARTDLSCAWSLLSLATACGRVASPPSPHSPSANRHTTSPPASDTAVSGSGCELPPPLPPIQTGTNVGAELLLVPAVATSSTSGAAPGGSSPLQAHSTPRRLVMARGTAAAAATGTTRIRCTAHVFLQRYRELYDPHGAAFQELVETLNGPLRSGSAPQFTQTVAELLRSTGTCSKFALRKLAAAVLPTVSINRRQALRQHLGLCDIKSAENSWTKAQAFEILMAVCSKAPHLARIPTNLRTTGASADSDGAGHAQSNNNSDARAGSPCTSDAACGDGAVAVGVAVA